VRRRFVVACAAACALVVGALAACSASSSSLGPVDQGQPEAGVVKAEDAGDAGDGAETSDASATPKIPAEPSLVLVNGLIDAGQTGLDDIRVCIDSRQYALPDAVPMPMSNYPGIGRGTGVDLGAAAYSVTLRVFRAVDLRTDAAWSTRTTCTSWESMATFTTLTLNLGGGPNLVVLVDDPNGTGGIGARIGSLPQDYAGGKDSLQMVPAEFSTFAKSGSTLHVLVNGIELGSGASGVLAPIPYALSTLGPSFDATKVRFERRGADAATVFFEQTLGSAQFLADPTTTTASYFDRRSNYAFVLLGDATNPVAADAKDLQFNGKGLHVVAVPYVAVPK
jgi:hypothetical protein